MKTAETKYAAEQGIAEEERHGSQVEGVCGEGRGGLREGVSFLLRNTAIELRDCFA